MDILSKTPSTQTLVTGQMSDGSDRQITEVIVWSVATQDDIGTLQLQFDHEPADSEVQVALIGNRYTLGNYSVDQVKNCVGLGEITPDQYAQITGQSYTLTDAQQAKATELINAYDQALATGFMSEASGTSLTYGYTPTDQIKWMKLYIGEANGVLPASQPVATANGTIVNLTQAQLQQLLIDLETFEQTQETSFHTRLAQTSVATTVDEVNAIHW